MALTQWGGLGLSDPFFDNLERSIDRAFNRTFGGTGALTTFAPPTAPMLWSSVAGTHPMDVVETANTFEIHADAPGFSPDDIHVELNEGQITVRGEKRVQEEKKDEKGRVWRRERGHRTFTRTFALPDNADPDEVTATLDKGVLTVTVGKKEETPKPEPKRVQVRAGAGASIEGPSEQRMTE